MYIAFLKHLFAISFEFKFKLMNDFWGKKLRSFWFKIEWFYWHFPFFQRNFGEFEIPRDLIERGDRLGSGSFGTVYSGIYHHPNDGDIQCAIKEARSEELGDSFREKLLDEAYIMRYTFNRE